MKKKVILKYLNSANSVGGDSSVSFEDSFADFESVKWPSRPEPANDSHLAQNFEPSHEINTLEQQINKLELQRQASFSYSKNIAPNYAAGMSQPPAQTFAAGQTYPSGQTGFNPFSDSFSTNTQHFIQPNSQPRFHSQNNIYMNASQPTPNPQTLPAEGSNNSDRYAALADLDQEVRIKKTVDRRSQFQKQISVGQQIFGATPSSIGSIFFIKNFKFLKIFKILTL